MLLKAWLKQNKEFFTLRDQNFLIKNIGPLETSLDGKVLAYLDKIKESYQKGMPMAYILGKEEFYGLEFTVDKRVLIPRPETELLVERSLELIRKNSFRNILDLCCGSGAIAVAIKKNSSVDISLVASDISIDALAVASQNVIKYKAGVELVKSDLFEQLTGRRFDLIVSNPPYVARDEAIPELGFEPSIALYADDGGLACIRKILKDAPAHLAEGGFLLIEVGYQHYDNLDKYIKNISDYDGVEWIKDHQGHYRVVCLRCIKTN